jgi:hypothetical protein
VAVSWPQIVELRQYTLKPGQRDVLIRLFEREFVESQIASGIAILGMFRDAGDPDRFVWLRGFPDMQARAASLEAFYYGPAWRANRAEANDTMIDSDNVLLLRPTPLPVNPAGDRLVGNAFTIGVISLDEPCDASTLELFREDVMPALEGAGWTILGCFETEDHENTFPALPVREGEHALVYLASRPAGLSAVDDADSAIEDVLPRVGAATLLGLIPTERSPLGGASPPVPTLVQGAR